MNKQLIEDMCHALVIGVATGLAAIAFGLGGFFLAVVA